MFIKVTLVAILVAVLQLEINARFLPSRQNRDYIQYPLVASNGPWAFSGNLASGGWGSNSRGGDGNQVGTFVGNGNYGGYAGAGNGGYSSNYQSYGNYPYYGYW